MYVNIRGILEDQIAAYVFYKIPAYRDEKITNKPIMSKKSHYSKSTY